MNMSNKKQLPEFHMFVGLPASSKSTVAQHLAQLNGGVVISSDEIRFNEGITDNTEVFDLMRIRTKEALRAGKTVYYDATNMSRKRRIALLGELKNIPCDKICHLMVVPVYICKQRNALREGVRCVPDDVYDRMLRSFNPPFYTEGWDTILLNNGGFNYLGQYPSWVMQISREDLGIPQDNSHHDLSLLEHMDQTAVLMNRMHSEGLPLWPVSRAEIIEVAQFHDIGKYFTKDFHNYKGEPSSEAHYYGHENYGAYLFLLMKFCESENSNLEDPNNPPFFKMLYQATVLSLHMRPYLSWKDNPKNKEKDIRLFGPDIISDVDMLHECDLRAHSKHNDISL